MAARPSYAGRWINMQKKLTQPYTVLSVFGTRPEAIKMCPLVQAVRRDPVLRSVVCVTAQHRALLDQVLDVFDVVPDYDLNLMKAGQTLYDITAGTLLGLKDVLAEVRPDIVLVHGDTTTSFAAALSAFYQQFPVGHVEAGLRTYDRYSPYPEEMNRQLNGRLSTLHFAPTQQNADNLAREGLTENVYLTGNTVIDALAHTVREPYTFAVPALNAVDFAKYRTITMTAHRRENLGAPMRSIFTAVKRIVEAYPDVQVIYPMHPNPQVREPAREILGGLDRVHLIDPVEVVDMHNLIARSFFVMTDSGGIQEEAPSLGKPVLVLRTETERPEAVAAGTVRVVGVEEADVYAAASTLLDDPAAYQAMAKAVNPYGDGHASERICAALRDYFGGQGGATV